jgi:hypothetical protein
MGGISDNAADSTENDCALSANNSNTDSSGKTERERTKCNLRPKTIIVSGFAGLPEEIADINVSGCIIIELEIDPVDSTIADMSSNLATSLWQKILHSTLIGNKVDEGIEEAISQLENRFFAGTKGALISALKDAYSCYKEALKKIATPNSE